MSQEFPFRHSSGLESGDSGRMSDNSFSVKSPLVMASNKNTPIREQILPHHMKRTPQNRFALISMCFVFWSSVRPTEICRRSKIFCFLFPVCSLSLSYTTSPPLAAEISLSFTFSLFCLLSEPSETGGELPRQGHTVLPLPGLWEQPEPRHQREGERGRAAGGPVAAVSAGPRRSAHHDSTQVVSVSSVFCSLLQRPGPVSLPLIKSCWRSFPVQTICTVCGSICTFVCAARARGVLRTLKSSTKSCSTSRLLLISPPL